MKVEATADLRMLVAEEALAANRAAPFLTDENVGTALGIAARSLLEERAAVLAANRVDCELGSQTLDEGTLDRLRLDDMRIEAVAHELETTARLEPLEREIRSWVLPNGLHVSERRIPIGTVGANFEARPNVAVDIAAQLLKSLNTVVLRTGAAALRTVTVLVDDVLRPALDAAGIPPGAIGLVRSSSRDGARVLVSMPEHIPLVILRGSGQTTAALGKLAAEHGVRTLAHAHGGGVLYVHRSAERDRVLALIETSLDRLGVCNRLNLVLVDRDAMPLAPAIIDSLRHRGLEIRATPSFVELSPQVEPVDAPLGHEWANDHERVATVTLAEVDDLDSAVKIANEQTSGLAACIIAEDREAAERFLDMYRGTTAFWHASTRFTDGAALTGVPETGVNVEWAPGPRGPVTYRDLWLRQYRVVGDGSQRR
jgi:glutamate-5-semialdehyde dehydrogenase